MNRYALENWLMEQDMPMLGGQPDPMGGQAPMGGASGMVGPEPQQGMPPSDPSVTNPPPEEMPGNSPEGEQQPPEDASQDPESPDMPEEKEDADFEQWKKELFKASIKGDTQEMLDMLNKVREADQGEMKAYQRKFVEDNFQIQTLKLNSNVSKASKEIRKMIKDQLDRNNPATSVISHISAVLETDPMLSNIFVKLDGYGGLKGDLHRKFIAALTGSVQVSSGADGEDIIFNEREYSIMMSTRFAAKWGKIKLGDWSLREDDPEKYLSEPELKRLDSGSPEEKDVLRRRIVLESIADKFEQRAFIFHVVDDNGTVYSFGWDAAGSLRSAYTEGKLVVRTRHSENSEAMIDDNGQLIPLIDLDIYYAKETGQQDEDGMPEIKEIEFMQRRNGMLFLTATVQTIKEAASAMQGSIFKETPYNGNPSDLKTLRRCVYTTHDLLMKIC
jgi:hypothetical protein